jgi:hypothetical protein
LKSSEEFILKAFEIPHMANNFENISNQIPKDLLDKKEFLLKLIDKLKMRNLFQIYLSNIKLQRDCEVQWMARKHHDLIKNLPTDLNFKFN